MANELQTGSADQSSVTGLVTGIINDAQELFKQQLALLKAEVRDDLRKTRDAALALGVGAGVAAVGGVMLCWMLAYLLNWAVGDDRLPLWACVGIVGGLLTLVGGVLLYLGKKKFDSFNPLPDETAQALKENVEWITKPK
jgi:Putative Actinobacterial Holin-X, holin superfamily III